MDEVTDNTPLADIVETLAKDISYSCFACGHYSIDCKYNNPCEFQMEKAQKHYNDLIRWRDQAVKEERERIPKIVCLCGSTRFGDAFQKAQIEKTLNGEIVLTIGCNMKSDTEIFGHLPESKLIEIKTMLDELHKKKD